MSESSDKEIHNPIAFGREETESDVLRVSEGANEESVESEGIVEGFIEKGRTGPSGSGTVVVTSTSVGVKIPVGVPLPKRNRMSLYKLEELKMEYRVPDLVGLRLPTSTDVVRYPPKGCVMIFSAMYNEEKKQQCLGVRREKDKVAKVRKVEERDKKKAGDSRGCPSRSQADEGGGDCCSPYQGSLAHDPISRFEGARLYTRVIVFGNTLFIS
ncbi:unnamed protein product [Prunus brigantina]